ncbi:helix-turn-helix transcriptional regulator [Nocardioides sp. JQ2195]|uniref:helix-turn-helix domain-containing protein n=1 Tax=Nocardioides sp. JQ2195 TaxID=2592334 RepID=UPI00143E564B|nr:helix-turn-helix transcriptional regulator [Nocardioides sp. JQ2195]QIX28450.1 helix-turn-helix transcriptional regulator [Nocardioides sp. JQ2195]
MGHLLPLPVPSAPETMPVEPEPLWREVTGDLLRERRHQRGEKLSETAGRAGISTQYLSEIERGRKDPSSEVLSAVAGALDLTLRDLAGAAARRLHAVPQPPLALAA